MPIKYKCDFFFAKVSNVAQSATYLTADQEAASSILAGPILSWRFIIKYLSTAILPSADLRRVVARYKQKYVHEVVNHLVHFAQKKGVVR